MRYLEAGTFHVATKQKAFFGDVTFSEIEYDYRFIDWHYHENSYFSFVTKGGCRDIGKRGTIECAPDSLLFHNYQEPHYNTRAGGVSEAFQVELSRDWGRRLGVAESLWPASAKITNPHIKLLFHSIYKEVKQPDDTSRLTIDALLLQALEMLRGGAGGANRPQWVATVDEMLRDNFDQPLSLQGLSAELKLHAAHLSRDFPRYFNCNFSQYLRKIRVEKSLGLLRNKKLSLTDIALTCGFADQSHFIRCFKEFNGVTPKAFRRLMA
jgi:AraC-like DNA-binding protein